MTQPYLRTNHQSLLRLLQQISLLIAIIVTSAPIFASEQKNTLSSKGISTCNKKRRLIAYEGAPKKHPSTYQQSYQHALAVSIVIGGTNALSCSFFERHLPLFWPFNVIAARLIATLLLPSFTFAYLAYAEDKGLSCHSQTMHISATTTDWATYFALKKMS